MSDQQHTTKTYPGLGYARNFRGMYPYPVVAFGLTFMGWLCMFIAVILQSDTGLIWGYSGLAMIALAALASIIGFFKTSNKKFRWLCVLSAFGAITPFLFYFFVVYVILPFILSGIAGPN